MDLRNYVFNSPRETKYETASKAFTHIQAKFEGLDVDDVVQMITFDQSQIEEWGLDESEVKVYLCLCAYKIQADQKEHQQDETHAVPEIPQSFLQFLVKTYIESPQQANRVFALRILAYLANRKVYSAIMEERTAFVNAIVANNDLESEDAQYLIVQLSEYGLKELVNGNEAVLAELKKIMSE